MSPMLAMVALTSLLSGASAAQVAVSPLQKVLSMLTNLEATIKKDGAEEQKAYEEYAEWCRTGAKDKEFEITTAKANIEDLTATIGKAESDISTFSSKVQDLASSISANDADLSAASDIRKKEAVEFTAVETELVDAVDTLERAVNILQRKLHGSAMLQAKIDNKNVKQLIHTLSLVVDAAALSLHDKQKLLGLVQNTADADDDQATFGAPAAAAYEAHSDSIIDVLDDLKDKATAQLEEARREETNARHNFELLKQSLSDQIKVDTKALADSKTGVHEATETKANAESELTVTTKDLTDAEHVLKNMDGDCIARARDHEATLKNREEELTALAGAKTAISDMTGAAGSIVYASGSFLQISGHNIKSAQLRTRADLDNFEVVNLVRKLAREHKSEILAQLAGQISVALREGAASGDDPFAKVKALITEMIERLVKQGGEEASHKAYCDKEMGDTSTKLDELKYDITKLSSKIDKAKSESVMLKDDVAVLTGEVLEIVKSQGAADALRKEETTIYIQTKSDLEQGLQGVRMALKLLREYYMNEGEAAMFAQQPAAPKVHAKSDAGSGIIGMLEVVESDLGRSLASTEMNEDAAASAYQRLTMDNKLSKTTKDADVKYKSKEATGLDKSLLDLSSDRDSVQTELDAVLKYSANIRAMCENKPESHEERVRRREEEIAGLKEALQILEGEMLFLQNEHRHIGFLQRH